MLKSFRRFLRSVLTYLPSTRRARLEERITPEQMRIALEQMLADPHHRRALVHTLIGAATGVQGGTTVPAQDVCPGAFGANCAPGDYTLAGKLGIGTTLPSDKLEVLQGSAGRVVLGGAGDSFGPGVARGYVGLNINWNPATNDFTARGDGANNGGAIVFGDIFGNTYVAAIPSSGGGNQTVSPATLLSNTRLFVNGAGGFVQFSSNDGIALNQRVSNVALPYGLWRLIASGAHYWIQENTAPGGDFSSARTVMMLQSGGNVAIGPAAPQRRLHVQGGANDDYQLRLEAAAGRAVALEMFEGSTGAEFPVHQRACIGYAESGPHG